MTLDVRAGRNSTRPQKNGKRMRYRCRMPLVAPDPIETARLVVRLVTPADLAALLVVHADDEVTRYLPYATWTSPADAQAWFQRMAGIQATGTALQFVVVDKTSAAAIGTCLLFRFDEAVAQAELGYVLGRRHWGRGCMHEALAALIDCAFDRLMLQRLEAKIDPRNVASTRVVLRLGFIQEGQTPQRVSATGETIRDEILSLSRDAWRGAAD
jgi:[ribosomal protein S5]-alanine N-acetyltransferase